jgi:dolichol-phosphate mannosyltransferase
MPKTQYLNDNIKFSTSESYRRSSVIVPQKPKVVVVMPALNEEGGVSTIGELKKTLKHCTHEVLVVDGYSKDRTVAESKRQGAVVIYQMGKGYGDALFTGFLYGLEHLHATIFLVMDADGSYDVRDAPELIEPLLRREADYVTGRRKYDSKAMRDTNRLGNWVISFVTRHLLRIPVHDSQTGMFAFRSYLVEGTDFRTRGWAINTEMLKLAAEMEMVITEVPVHYHSRVGDSKLGLVSGTLANLAVIFRMMRDTEPLLMFGSAAILFVAFGALTGSSVVAEWFLTGTETHVGTAILAALSVIVGIQLMAFGLLSDMIKQVRRKTRPRDELFFKIA